MSLIENISFGANFEIIRARIASILADELAAQKALNIIALAEEEAKPSPDEELIKQYQLNIDSIPDKVWEERFRRPQESELPVLNVVFSQAPLNDLITTSTQVGEDKYTIEVYQGSPDKDVDTTRKRGDELATLKLHRLLGICRSIIMDRNYIALGFNTTGQPNIIGGRRAENIIIAEPDEGTNNSFNLIMGKVDVTVKATEEVVNLAGVELAINETTLQYKDYENGYYWTTGPGTPSPTTYNLTLISGDGGSVTHTNNDEVIEGDGVYSLDINDIIPINALPDVDSTFLKWVIGAIENLASATYVKITDNITATAQFIITLQNLFNSIPISGSWFLPDATVNDNKVLINNVGVANFHEAPYFKLTGQKLTGNQPITINTTIWLNDGDVFDYTLFSSGGQSAGNKGLQILVRPSGLTVSTSDGSSFINLGTGGIPFEAQGKYDITFFWDGVGTIGEVTINGVRQFLNGMKPWIGDSAADIHINRLAWVNLFWANWRQSYFEIEHTFHSKWSFKEGWDKYIIDEIGTNDVELIDHVDTTFWGQAEDNIEPRKITLGFNRFQQIADDTKFMDAINKTDGTPTTTIIGYNLFKTFSAYILNDDPYVLKWPESVPLSENVQLLANNFYSYGPNMTEYRAQWDGATTYNITADGLGDYTTPRAAVNDQNGVDFIKINVQSGIYFVNDLQGKHNVWLNAVGVVIFIADGLSTAISPADYSFGAYANTAYNLIPQDFKHCFYVHENMLITGFSTFANDVKYVSHQDLAAAGAYTSIFENYTSKKTENNAVAYRFINGIGSYENQNQIYLNGSDEFFSTEIVADDQSSFFWHNGNAQSAPASLLLEGCTAITGHLLLAQEEESGQNDLITAKDCVIDTAGKGLVYLAADSGYVYNNWVLGINTPMVLTTVDRPDGKELELSTDKILYGDTDNFVEGAPYTGAIPRNVGFENVIALVDEENVLEITKDANSVSELKIKQ